MLAVLALVFAMVGTAIAGTDGLSGKITKSKVKSIAKKQADMFLMPVGEHDELFRMAIGGAPLQSATSPTMSAASASPPSGDRVVVWAHRDLRCADLNCAGLPPQAKHRQRPHLRRAVHPPLGHLGGARQRVRGCSDFALTGGKLAGNGVPLTGTLVGDTPSKPFGGAEEIAFSPDGRTVYFTLREAGRIEPKSTNMDIFAGAQRRLGPAGQFDRRQ